MVPAFLRQKFILFLTKLSTKRLYYFFKSQSAKPIFILCFSKFIIYKTILSLTQICSLIFTYWSVTTTFYIFRVKNIVQTINNLRNKQCKTFLIFQDFVKPIYAELLYHFCGFQKNIFTKNPCIYSNSLK